MVDVALVANVATAIAVIVAVGFGIAQVRQQERKRRDHAAVELVRALQTPEFLAAEQLVWSLPDAVPRTALAALGREAEMAAVTVGSVFEGFGVLVFRRALPLEVVQDVAGVSVRSCWRKLQGYVDATRKARGTPAPYEWFQWLAERLAERSPSYKTVGAHVAFREWRP